MKKQTITILLILTVAILGKTQNTFELRYGNYKFDALRIAIQDSDNNYVIIGNIYSSDSGDYEILKVSPSGEILQSTIGENPMMKSDIITGIVEYENNYKIIGTALTGDSSYFITVRVFDKTLNMISEKYELLIEKAYLGIGFSFIDNNSNIVMSGNWITKKGYNSNSFYKPLFVKFDFEGNIIDTSFWTHPNGVYSTWESPDYNHYYCTFEGNITKLSKNFDSITSYQLNNIEWAFSPIYYNDSTVIVLGDYKQDFQPNYHKLIVEKLNQSYELLDAKLYFKDSEMLETPGLKKSVCYYNDNIYLGGSSNFALNPYISTIDSWYHLIKVDEDLNTIWEKWYGGDAYYNLKSILATNDGGCLMIGSRYDENEPEYSVDSYIIKVDADGIVGWEKEIPIPQSIAQVFPNPGKDKLILRSTITNADFQLTDLQGKSLLQKHIHQKTTEINTQKLPSGTYLWTLSKKGKVLESGKWVCE